MTNTGPAAASSPAASSASSGSPRRSRPVPVLDLPLPLTYALLLLRTVALLVSAGICAGLFGSWDRGLVYSSVGIVAVDALTLIVISRVLRGRGQSLRGLLQPRLRDTGWGLLTFVILMVAFLIATFLGNLIVYAGPPPAESFDLVPPLWLGLWTLIVMPFTVALAEEAVYRGVGQRALTPRIGHLGAVVVTSAFFALQHIGLTPLDLRAQLARFIGLFLVGLLLGWLANRFGRLWPLVIGHWLLDVLGLGLPMLLGALAR